MSERIPGDPVPAVKESEAEGEIASIFADIRASLGTSSVNLIWRHLATFPGALPWCWKAIAPLLRAGELGDLAQDYRKGLDGPTLPQMPGEVLEVLGLRSDDIAQISSMLRGYHVSCTMNVLSLNALLLVLKGAKAGVEHEAARQHLTTGSAREAPKIEKMARLLDPAEMPSHVADLAWRLNALGERGDGRILASLYRYLANWPSFLALSWALIAPLAADGRLQAAIERTLVEADRRAPELVPRLAPPAAISDTRTEEAVRAALEDFARNAIAKVIPISGALLTAVGSPIDSPPR